MGSDTGYTFPDPGDTAVRPMAQSFKESFGCYEEMDTDKPRERSRRTRITRYLEEMEETGASDLQGPSDFSFGTRPVDKDLALVAVMPADNSNDKLTDDGAPTEAQEMLCGVY